MKKKALKFGTVGFLFGCFAYLLFSIIVSLRMNTGDFYFVLPALKNEYSNELLATIVQIATFTWLGIACGVAYMFSENVEFEPKKQGVGYLVSLTLGIFPLAWTGQWYKHIFIGIFSYIIIVAIISLFLFVIGLVKLKCDVDEIRHAIGIGEEVNHEKI